MKSPRHVGALLILGMVSAVLIAHLPVVYTLFYHHFTDAPIAEEGTIQLSDASEGERIVLDGEWEFYWNRLLVTDAHQETAPDFFIRVPDYWSRYKLGGKYLPSDGFASYRLTMKGVHASRPATVWIPDFGSAYQVFIDGTLASESGTVSKNPAEVFATARPDLFPVHLSPNQDHEVVIEVATARFSGLYMAPVMMDYDSAMRNAAVRHNVRLILFGAALFSFFVLIVGYILSFRSVRRSLWLPITGLLVLLRIMLTTEFFSLWQSSVFFNLSYEATNPLMFFLTFAFNLLIYLTEELIGIAFSSKEKLWLLLYYMALYLIFIFVPQAFYNRYLTVLLPLCSFLIEIYAFFKIYRNRKHLKKYSLFVYLSTVLTIAGLIIHCYYINGNIYPNMSLALLSAFTICMMILALVSTIQASDIARDYALSCAHLASAKAQIAMQTAYYDALSAQMNEVRAVRHDLHHVVNVLKRLSDEGRYAELSSLLDEYAEKSITEPLPVFCENVVANSILGYYSLSLKEQNIPFSCACCIPKELPVSDSDLCIVLGNALENAMEACAKLGSASARSVSAEVNTIGGQLLIKITNTYNGTVSRAGERYLSTKYSRITEWACRISKRLWTGTAATSKRSMTKRRLS